MLLRNKKTYGEDSYYEWSDIDPVTGECRCLDCQRIEGCVFHEHREAREKKARQLTLARIGAEADEYALEKSAGDAPSGVKFIDFYLLHYRVGYDRAYDRTYREMLKRVTQTDWNRLMRKKDKGFICELCVGGKVW
jgi:hypothetical protein